MNYYLSPLGDDRNTGDEKNPWRTVAAALSRLGSGDTVVMEDGVWRESLDLRNRTGITWKARNPGQAILDGSAQQSPSWIKGPEGIWRATWPGAPPNGLFLGTYEASGSYCCCYDGRYAQFDPTRPGGVVVPGSKSQWRADSGVLQLTTVNGGNPRDENLVIVIGDIAITLDGATDTYLDGIATRYWRSSVGTEGGKNIALTSCAFRYSAQTSVWLTAIDGAELTGCVLQGGGSMLAHAEDVIHCEGGRAKLQRLDVSYGGHGLMFCQWGGAFTVLSSHFHDSGGSGITLVRNVNGVLIEGCWFENCATQRSPSVRDVGAAVQMHGNKHQVRDCMFRHNSKHFLLSATGPGTDNPTTSDNLFERNTLLDAEETAIEYQQAAPAGEIARNIWRDTIILRAGLDSLSCWFAGSGAGNGPTNRFERCQVGGQRIRGTLGTFTSVELAAAALPAVYQGCSSGSVQGAGSSLLKPPTPDAPTPPTPPTPPIDPPDPEKPPVPPITPGVPVLNFLEPPVGKLGDNVTITGQEFGAGCFVLVAVTIKPETPSGLRRMEPGKPGYVGSSRISATYIVPDDAVTGDVFVRNVQTQKNSKNRLRFTLDGGPPLPPPLPINKPPIAHAGGPYSGIVGMPVQFDGSRSTDPDGRVTAYHWSFGDGSTPGGIELPVRTYATAGTYTVTLTVTDDKGATATATTTATISAAPPPAGLSIDRLFVEQEISGASFDGHVEAGTALPAGSTVTVTARTPDGRSATATVTVAAPLPPPPPPPTDDATFEAAVIALTNVERARANVQEVRAALSKAIRVDAEVVDADVRRISWEMSGGALAALEDNGEPVLLAVGALVEHLALSKAARDFAAEMVRTGVFSHIGEGGTTPGDRIQRAGYTGATTWGENIAQGFNTPESLVAAWMASPGHRANLLNPAFREIGVGKRGVYAVQVFASRGSLPPPPPTGGIVISGYSSPSVKAGQMFTITGSGFKPDALVEWDGLDLKLISVFPTKITAIAPTETGFRHIVVRQGNSEGAGPVLEVQE